MTPPIVNLTVQGEPVSKGRPRVFHGHGVTPRETREAEQRIRLLYRSKYGMFSPYSCPVQVMLTFRMGTRRRKDYDNMAKLVTDALNGLAYEDDSQIVLAMVVKILPPADRRKRGLWKPRTEITISPADLPSWKPGGTD